MNMLKKIGNKVEDKLEYMAEERPNTLIAAAWSSYIVVIGLVGLYYVKDYKAKVRLTEAMNTLSEILDK